MKKGRLWIILGVVGVVLIGAFFGWRRLQARGSEEELRTAVVERGTLRVTVSASGRIQPEAEVDLSFDAPGEVAEVSVELGDSVEAGQLLAQLETTDLERAVTQAELNLQQAELRLERLQEPPDEPEIRRAEHRVDQAAAALEVAQINRRQVLSSTLLNESLDDARSEYEDAKADYEENLEEYQEGDLDYWYVDRALDRLEDAELALSRVQHQVDLQRESATNEVTQAWQNYQEAQDNLEELLEGTDPREVELAQLDVDTAALALENARADLEEAQLTAPFDGVVGQVNITAGEAAPTGLPAIVLVDTSRFHINVSVDEIDVANLEEGLPVEVTVDALSDEAFTGYVERIGPAATVDQGAVSYPVEITLDSTDAALRAGMSATAVVMVEEITDQLLIPNWIVRIDENTGQTYVYEQTPEGPQRVDVELGIRYEGRSQVLDGLEEGQTLVLVRNQENGFFGAP
jgi:HlyD family secretion protein